MMPSDAAEKFLQGDLVEMPRPDCLRHLHASRVGRVAYNSEEGPVVVPVNARVHGNEVFLRTRPDSQLGRALRGGTASYQVDGFDDHLQTGWSVLLQGEASWVEGADLPAYVSERPVPWAGGDRSVYVRIRATNVTGRTLLP